MEKWMERYEAWLQDPGISPEDKEALRAYGEKEIRERFHEELAFGTAGIRGVRGLGTAVINSYLIRRVTQGYCDYLLNLQPDARERGVAIAYDSRHMSKDFALEAAMVFSGNGIRVYFYDRIRSTPELSFAIRHLKALGGLVLTASHNPPEYNGYKAYNETGCQLSTEETAALTARIDAIPDFASVKLDSQLSTLVSIGDEVEDVYVQKILDLSLEPFNPALKIAYSPLFGVGLKPVERIFRTLGADYVLVQEQSIPDGDFPTARKPNPEEQEALVRLVEEGRKAGADLLLATDPDADRLGVMALDQGEYRYLSGNQIGALLIDYILSHKSVIRGRSHILTSIVTSNFGKTVGVSYGAETTFTFTGFKNLGKKMEELLLAGDEVFFVYEESIGYLAEDFIRDKDGISAAFLVAEMAGFLKRQGKTLADRLRELYQAFGYFTEKQISIVIPGVEGTAKIRGIMKDLRDNGPGDFGSLFQLASATDYGATPLDGETTDLLYYAFADGSWAGVRPSGTEPKLKLYINVTDPGEEMALKKADALEAWFRQRISAWV